MTSTPVSTLIVGAGLAGLSTAHHLLKAGQPPGLLIESSHRPGGKAVTDSRDGFDFDVTGHWLHMRDADIKRWIFGLTGPEAWVEVERKSHVFSHGVYTLYPFQANFYGLPLQVQKECIKGFIEAQYRPTIGEPRTFEEWVLKYMGEGIAKHFMIPYNEKLWTVHPREMTPLWCQIYVPKPSLDELLDGALTAPERKMGYNATFVYPRRGGIAVMANALAAALPTPPEYGVSLTGLNLARKEARLSDGRILHYERMVSTMPLKYLAAITDDLTETDRLHAEQLSYQSVAYFNIGLKRKPGGVHTHWVYFPEPDFVFYRVGFPSNAVETTAPPGQGSVYVEISYRGELSADPADLWRRTVEGLVKARIIDGEQDVLFHEFRTVPCAYCLFDQHHATAVPALLSRYAAAGVHSIGRYGRWTYNSMETALIDGRDVVKALVGDRG